ncbi:hypothetical protein [Streptomyces sp. SAS_260]|uniref:hypothetical protein n=1 Tax=Streptomyces sp. SAS_260 TaxID=3412751 RepID=UPI00403D225E
MDRSEVRKSALAALADHALTCIYVIALIGGALGIAGGAWWLVRRLDGPMAAGYFGALLLLRISWQLRKRVKTRRAQRETLWKNQGLNLSEMHHSIRAEQARLALHAAEWLTGAFALAGTGFAAYCLLDLRNGPAASTAFLMATAAFEGNRLLVKHRQTPTPPTASTPCPRP